MALDALASSSRGLEGLAMLAAQLEERYGEAARGAAMLVRELGEAAGRLAPSLDSLYAQAASALYAISRMASAGASKLPPKPSEVIAAVADLASKLPGEALRGLSGVKCSGHKLPRILAVLSGLEGFGADSRSSLEALSASLESLRASLRGLPKVGLIQQAAKIEEAVREVASEAAKVEEKVRGSLSLLSGVLRRLAEAVADLASRLSGIAKLYDAATAAAAGLPAQLRERALRALEEEASVSKSLSELEERLAKAPELLAELAKLSGSVEDELEKLSAKLREKLDRLISLFGGNTSALHVQPEGEHVGAEV
jgi:uncharacterized phage infection (PIP) family protein YhgE